MGYTGTNTAGKVYTAKGVTSGNQFLPIGSLSGLTENGVLIAHGTSAFTASAAGFNGQVLIASTGNAPAFATISSTGGTISFTTGANSLNMEAGGAVPTTFTADSGSAAPAANNLNVFGLSGSKITGSGSTLTVKSPPFSQIGASATSSLNTGEFVNGAYTRTLPASAGLADGDLFIYACTTASALVIQSVGAQKIRLGSSITAAAGTLTSTAIGDSVSLRFNGTDGFFYAVSSVGNWTVT